MAIKDTPMTRLFQDVEDNNVEDDRSQMSVSSLEEVSVSQKGGASHLGTASLVSHQRTAKTTFSHGTSDLTNLGLDLEAARKIHRLGKEMFEEDN